MKYFKIKVGGYLIYYQLYRQVQDTRETFLALFEELLLPTRRFRKDTHISYRLQITRQRSFRKSRDGKQRRQNREIALEQDSKQDVSHKQQGSFT